jgi:UDP-N-acetylglucosamine--N-acetylmuramyl-(pentapeptide) pyrophosphoryl-undecaprenol N-acetylglucosamine transferase
MKQTLLCTGGGTLGPVTPLLAMVQAARRLEPKLEVCWIGTPEGPERALIEAADIPFYALPVVKLPRYPSLRWLTFPLDWYRARREASRLITEIQPDVVVTAGGFTAVPVIFAARKKGVPCAMHQLDLKPGLANRQVAGSCQSITTSFEYARPPFRVGLADERIPTPTRFRLTDLPTRTKSARTFGLEARRPITLVFGGGTGALAINAMMEKNQTQWLSCTQVIHLTGKGKHASTLREQKGYVVREFLQDEMIDAFAAADLVICRAGFATLSEMTAALKKPTIVIPLPGTEQELNARAFEEQGAVIVVNQETRSFEQDVFDAAALLLRDTDARKEMGEAAYRFLPTDDGTVLAKRILRLMGLIKK